MTAFQLTLRRLAGGAVLALALLPAAASAASDVTGVWINDTGRGAVEIKPCGSGVCGHVVWVKDGSDAKGCGRQIIGDARQQGSVWGSGWIYSPERKKRYDVELKPLDGGDRLRVMGYAGSKFFSKTMIWKRAPADLQRCGTVEAKAATPEAKVAPTETKAAGTETTSTTASETPAPAATPAVDAGSATAAAPEAAATTDTRSAEAKLRDQLNADSAEQAATAPATTDDSEGTETADAGNLDLGNLKLDKYLKRRDGKCDLDLPWVKVSFNCEK